MTANKHVTRHLSPQKAERRRSEPKLIATPVLNPWRASFLRRRSARSCLVSLRLVSPLRVQLPERPPDNLADWSKRETMTSLALRLAVSFVISPAKGAVLPDRTMLTANTLGSAALLPRDSKSKASLEVAFNLKLCRAVLILLVPLLADRR